MSTPDTYMARKRSFLQFRVFAGSYLRGALHSHFRPLYPLEQLIGPDSPDSATREVIDRDRLPYAEGLRDESCDCTG